MFTPDNLPWELNLKGKKLVLKVYDYYDEDLYESTFCAAYQDANGNDEIYEYSYSSREDAKIKLAEKLNNLDL